MGEGGGGQTCPKTFLGHVCTCDQNFIQIGARVWVSINPLFPTDKQTYLYAHFYIYTKKIEDRYHDQTKMTPSKPNKLSFK